MEQSGTARATWKKVCINPQSGSSSENMRVPPKTSQGVGLDMCESPVYPFEDGEVAFKSGIAILPNMGVFSKPVTRPGNPLEHIWGLEQQSHLALELSGARG